MEITLAREREPLNSVEEELIQIMLNELCKLELPPPNEWQTRFLVDLCQNIIRREKENKNDFLEQYILCGAYGVGKTTIIIYAILMIMLWCDLTCPGKKFKSVIISGSEAQLYSVFWKDMEYVLKSTRGHKFFDIRNEKCFLKNNPFISLEPRVANISNLHSLAGIHADTVCVILEEAPAIPRQVLDKIMTFFSDTRGFLFVTGNPVKRDSFFYDIMETPKEGWNKYRIGRADRVKDLSKDAFTQRIVELYGTDADEYRISVLGEHGLEDTDTFFPEYIIQAALERPCVMHHEPYHMAIDVSTGGAADFSVILLRSENAIIDIYREKVPLHQFKLEVLSWIQQRMPSYICIDEVGIGFGLVDSLKFEFKISATIIGIKGGKNAMDQMRFANSRTELAWKAREWLQYRGSVNKNLPYVEDVLLPELRSLRGAPDTRGSYCLESKNKLSKSPDVADAFTYSFAADHIVTRRHRYVC